MPQLTRVRLCNIGHTHARIDDVILRLHDIEERSAHTTILLRNGGGKTMLVSLLLWLICPDKKMSDNRKIDDYVLPQDHSVIVAEWQLDGNSSSGKPDCFLTGTFCEWRSSSSTSEGRKLRRAFFVARSTPDEPRLTLENLPLYVHGQGSRERRTWGSFRQEWQALSVAYPQASITETEQIGTWRALLEQAGIDPELFHYQIHMNRHEAEAEALFKFRESDQFVDFFLEMMGNSRLGNTTAQTIERFRDALRLQSEQLEPEYHLIKKMLQELTPLSNAKQEREYVYHQVQQARQTLDDMTSYVLQKMDSIQRNMTIAKQQHDQAHDQAHMLRQEVISLRRRSIVLRCAMLQKRLLRLQVEYKNLQREVTQHQSDEIMWLAAIYYRDFLRAEAQVSHYEEQLAANQQEHAPLLQQLQKSAYQYASALSYKIEQLRTTEKQQQVAANAAHQEAKVVREHIQNKRTQITQFEAKAQRIDDQIQNCQKVRAQLEQDTVLCFNEQLSNAKERLRLQHAKMKLQKSSLRQDEQHIIQEQRKIQQYIQSVERRLSEVTGEEVRVRKQMEQAQMKRTHIEKNPLLLTVLELEEIDLDRLDQNAIHDLRKAEYTLDDHITQLRVLLLEHQTITKYLTDQRLLPPSREIMQTLDILREHNLTAWSGWEYLAENVRQEDRRSQILHMPELAFGIVVHDTHYQKARQILNEATLHLDNVVIVIPQATALNIPSRFEALFVIGPTSNAYFDRNEGEHELKEREIRHGRNVQQLDTLSQKRNDLRSTIDQVEQWMQDYPLEWWEELRTTLSATLEQKEICRIQILEYQHKREKGDEDSAENRLQQDDCWTAISTIEGHQSTLKAHENVLMLNVETLEQEHLHILGEVEHEKKEERELQNKVEGLDKQEQELIPCIRDTAAERTPLEHQYAHIHYIDNTQIVAQAEKNIQILQDHYEQLLAQYEHNIGADETKFRLQIAQEVKEKARQEFLQRLKNPVNESMVRAALEKNIDTEEIHKHHRQAIDAGATAKKQIIDKQREIAHAEGSLSDTRQKGQAMNIAEEEYSVDIPDEEHECLSEEEATERRIEECNEEAREYEVIEREERERIQVFSRQQEDFKHKHNQLQTVMASYAALYNASTVLSGALIAVEKIAVVEEEIEQDIHSLGETLNHAQREKQRLDQQRAVISRQILQELNETRLHYQKVTLTQRFLSYTEEDFEARCQALLDDLSLRLQHIEKDRTEMQTHRQLVLQHMLDLAEKGIELLKSAVRRSRLPVSLAAFQQRPFIKITFKEASHPEEKRSRLDGLLESIISEGTVPNGIELLQKSVRRLTGPINVEVLFPDPETSRQYVPIARMAQESGGERLTSTVLLYCTLTQLRAIERTHYAGASSSLILDNPIGAASRPLLLELQREVAKAHNIQLIYTTAVQDFEAISMFPNIVRIKNDQRDRKSGEQIIQLDETKQGLQEMRVFFSETRNILSEKPEEQ